jgi:nicotinamidase-related amidase
MKNLHLLSIDPQNDFCDQDKGALIVAGADQDMKRLANFVRRLKNKIEDVHVTLDSHHLIHIAHPIFWKNSKGEHPKPFTLISVDDVENGVWSTTNPSYRARGLEYVKKLKTNSRYLLCIWPPHCLIGSWGHNIVPCLFEALQEWEKDFAMVNTVTKGSNPFTEHYSAVQADVPDSNDPTTMLNTDLISTLQKADIICISGEALSHCVANTIRDIANNFGDDNIKKFVFLEDTSSPVTGFENLAKDFVDEMKKRGMQVAKSTDFLA